MYHYVEYVKDPLDTIRKSLSITPFVFDKELEEIKNNNYQTLFVKEIPKIFKGDLHYNSKSIALTFDDGYEDFYTDAFPLLKKYKIFKNNHKDFVGNYKKREETYQDTLSKYFEIFKLYV